MERLREVQALFFQAGVTLKADKCHLFEAEVEYLGHVSSPGELRVNKNNMKALRQARQPNTQTELKSFLEMCNVYGRFHKDYALVARPLTQLTSVKLPAQLPAFYEKQTASFEILKKRLTTTPVLALPQREGQFVLETDACGVPVGCSLLQQQPYWRFLPIGYYSGVLSPAEKNDSTTERKCLAVVWVCFLLRPYLEYQGSLSGRTMPASVGSYAWTAVKLG